jgi:hypothetical protein
MGERQVWTRSLNDPRRSCDRGEPNLVSDARRFRLHSIIKAGIVRTADARRFGQGISGTGHEPGTALPASSTAPIRTQRHRECTPEGEGLRQTATRGLAGKPFAQPRSATVADSIKGKIENAGEAARDAAKKAGAKVKEGADTAAEKTADAAKATGNAVKDAGQKLKDKSGA